MHCSCLGRRKSQGTDSGGSSIFLIRRGDGAPDLTRSPTIFLLNDRNPCRTNDTSSEQGFTTPRAAWGKESESGKTEPHEVQRHTDPETSSHSSRFEETSVPCVRCRSDLADTKVPGCRCILAYAVSPWPLHGLVGLAGCMARVLVVWY